MFPFMIDYIPENLSDNRGFVNYLSTPDIMDKYAALLMMILPGDRLTYYKESDVAKMR